MVKQHVVCIVATEKQAAAIVNDLSCSGFTAEDVSVLLSDRTAAKSFIYEKHTKAPEVAVQAASAAGVLGGTVGLLAGIGTLAIPGLGAFIAAGPIMGALSGLAVGATVGGLAGALVGMGIPEFEAKQYEGKVQEGNVLLSVLTKTEKEREAVKNIFKKSQAADIAIVQEHGSRI